MYLHQQIVKDRLTQPKLNILFTERIENKLLTERIEKQALTLIKAKRLEMQRKAKAQIPTL